jgi:hypothetical protein
MTVAQVYAQYKVLPNLQQHMLRVAAFCEVLSKSWTGITIDTQAMIHTCLFHDIAKPITFDMSKQAQYVKSAAELEEIRQIHQNLIAKYGSNEHVAAIRVFQEIGLGVEAERLIDNLEWDYIPRLLQENDVASLIVIYSDMRIGPRGVLSIAERMENLRARAGVAHYEEQLVAGLELEKLMNENSNGRAQNITDQELESPIKRLLNLDVN